MISPDQKDNRDTELIAKLNLSIPTGFQWPLAGVFPISEVDI